MEVTQTVVNINSEHPEALQAFYRDLIGLKPNPDMGENALIAAQTPFIIDGHSELTSGAAAEPERTLWNFMVDDLAREQARLQALGVRFITTRPAPEMHHVSFSTFVDPDGNYGQLMQMGGLPAGTEMFGLMRHSADAERLRSFFRDVLGLSDDYPDLGNPCMPGGTPVYIGAHSGVHGPAREPSRILLNLFVADVAAEQKLLESKGVQFSRSMGREPWGGIISTFADPDGNSMQIIEFRPE